MGVVLGLVLFSFGGTERRRKRMNRLFGSVKGMGLVLDFNYVRN